MRKLFIALMLFAGLSAVVAGGWQYAHPVAATNSRTVDTLVCITTTPDTTAAFYFGSIYSRGTVWMRILHKNATLTTLKTPLIEYKLVDAAGKFYSADSADGWATLACSSHQTITAAETVQQFKALPAFYGFPGIVFKGTSTAESTKVLIRVTGEN